MYVSLVNALNEYNCPERSIGKIITKYPKPLNGEAITEHFNDT